jgi:enoyl-CoA hydratase/carnithine racemase
MAVRTEKDGAVWTIIHDRPEARNAMDPQSADALMAAFLEFDADTKASVAVFYGAGGAFCAGWDLKFVSTLNSEHPLGELDIPPAGHVAMVVKFRADRWDRLASNWTSLSSRQLKALPLPGVWSLACGAIFGSWRKGHTSASIVGVGACR